MDVALEDDGGYCISNGNPGRRRTEWGDWIKLLRNPVSAETPQVSEAIGEIPEFCEFKLTAIIRPIQSPLPDTGGIPNIWVT
jgi:hypothetical protein